MQIEVYVCHCGLNIGGVLDIDAIVAYAQELDGVCITRGIEFACSDAGQEQIRSDIGAGVDRVVIAACSPRMHQTPFERLLEDALRNSGAKITHIDREDSGGGVHREDRRSRDVF